MLTEADVNKHRATLADPVLLTAALRAAGEHGGRDEVDYFNNVYIAVDAALEGRGQCGFEDFEIGRFLIRALSYEHHEAGQWFDALGVLLEYLHPELF